MAILKLLFLDKLAITLLKGAHPCKISRLDFLNGQQRHSIGRHMVKLHLEGKLVILVNMNSAPLITLSVVKVY
jgi:hypothetical protein